MSVLKNGTNIDKNREFHPGRTEKLIFLEDNSSNNMLLKSARQRHWHLPAPCMPPLHRQGAGRDAKTSFSCDKPKKHATDRANVNPIIYLC